MEDSYEQGHQLRALAMRVAALEDNVAFLEEWCEEQQDALDRSIGPVVAYDYELDAEEPGPARRVVLRVVDLRDGEDSGDGDDDGATGTIVAMVGTDHERTVRQIRQQLNRLRTRLATALAPESSEPPERERPPRPKAPKLSEKPAGRTAP